MPDIYTAEQTEGNFKEAIDAYRELSPDNQERIKGSLGRAVLKKIYAGQAIPKSIRILNEIKDSIEDYLTDSRDPNNCLSVAEFEMILEKSGLKRDPSIIVGEVSEEVSPKKENPFRLLPYKDKNIIIFVPLNLLKKAEDGNGADLSEYINGWRGQLSNPNSQVGYGKSKGRVVNRSDRFLQGAKNCWTLEPWTVKDEDENI